MDVPLRDGRRRIGALHSTSDASTALVVLTPQSRPEPDGLRAHLARTLATQPGVTVWEPGSMSDYVDSQDFAQMLLAARRRVGARLGRPGPIDYGMLCLGTSFGTDPMFLAPFTYLDSDRRPSTVAAVTLPSDDGGVREFMTTPGSTFVVTDPVDPDDPASTIGLFVAGARRTRLQRAVAEQLRRELRENDPTRPEQLPRWNALRALLAGADHSGLPTIPVSALLCDPLRGGRASGGLLEIGPPDAGVVYVDVPRLSDEMSTPPETIRHLREGLVVDESPALRAHTSGVAVAQPVGEGVTGQVLADALSSRWGAGQTVVALNAIDTSSVATALDAAEQLRRTGYTTRLRMPGNATVDQQADAEALHARGVGQWNGLEPVEPHRQAPRSVAAAADRFRQPVPSRRTGLLLRPR